MQSIALDARAGATSVSTCCPRLNGCMTLAVAVVIFFWFRHSVAVDRRRLRNGVLLLMLVWVGLAAVSELLLWVGPLGLLPLGVLGSLLPLTVVVLIVFLVANGFTMLRKEGRSLSNLLSLLVGLALIAVPVVAALLLRTNQPVPVAIATFGLLCLAHLGVSFVVLLTWSYAYSQMSVRLPADGIVILGSGLIRARFRRCWPAGSIEPSRSAGMHWQPDGIRYWSPVVGRARTSRWQKGSPWRTTWSSTVSRPRRSSPRTGRTTHENLRLSRALLDQAGHADTMLVVTSSYHVLRAALLARDLACKPRPWAPVQRRTSFPAPACASSLPSWYAIAGCI